MLKENETLLPLHPLLNCFRPEVARGDPLRTDVESYSACSALLGGGDAFDQVLTFSDNKVFLSVGGRLAQQINLVDDYCPSDILQAGWVTEPVSNSINTTTVQKNAKKHLCILQGRTLHLISCKRVCEKVMLSHDYTSFWSLPCGLLLTSKTDAPPVLLSSFKPPFNIQQVNFPSDLSPSDLIWSSNKTTRSLPPLLASYDAIKSTIRLWQVEVSARPQRDSDGPGVEEVTPTQKRAALRHPNGEWSPLAFRPPPATPKIVNKEKPQNWSIKLLLEQSVPFYGRVCEVNFLENAGEQEGCQHSLCFTTASGGQVTFSLGGDTPPQVKSIKREIKSSTVVSPDWGPEVATDVKSLLELHQGGVLVSSSPSYPNELSFRAMLGQNRSPYLNILEDEAKKAGNGEISMADLRTRPAKLQHGSNRRATLVFQEEGGPKARRVSLDAVPIVSGELKSNLIDLFPIEEDYKILSWSSLQGSAATGDAELEMDALFRRLHGTPSDDTLQQERSGRFSSQSCFKLGESFLWSSQGKMESFASQTALEPPENDSVISKMIQCAKLNVLARRHILYFLQRYMCSNSPYDTELCSPTTYGSDLQDRLLHFENLLAWEANRVKSSDDDAKSIISDVLEGIVHDANDNGLPSKIINPSTLRIEIDTVPGEVTSAIQYLTGGSWSKILSQASSKKPSGRKTPFIGATEDLERHEICGPPYDYRPLRPQIASSTDILDGVSESIPAILEASYILDSSIPPALRGKAGRQGMISLQKTLAILASRQLALPLGRGALGLQTHRVLPTEQLRQPYISVAAEVTERNHAIINLDLSTAPPGEGLSELSAWPEFHAGVAEGLILASSGPLTRTWIVYSKPGAPSYSYGGVLLGLGLAGHLGTLSATDTYRYLSLEHEPTLMGFLLGIAVAKRCSMDASTYKLMRLHHRAECLEAGMGSLARIAATLGIGLLYQGSNHWSIIAILLEQFKELKQKEKQQTIGRIDNFAEEEENVDPESEMTVLAAGISIGLVVLGVGGYDSRCTGLKIQLRHLIEGSFANICDREGQEHRSNVLSSDTSPLLNMGQPTDDVENFNSIVPAAIIALGLMYLKTNDVDAADAFILGIDDQICPPRHLTLKIMMRALILWDAIEPTERWVWNYLPRNVMMPLSQIISARGKHSMALQAHCFSVAGACLALGIKFAGTRDTVAAETSAYFVHYFLNQKCKLVFHGKDDEVVENCMALCALSLSVIVAGSGDIKTFKLLRSLLKRVPVSEPSPAPGEVTANPPIVGYGSYSALSLALGFLFLSGGEQTFDTTKDAAAFLVIALFPHLPTTTTDNRYYLQALRHFYVLATKKQPCNSRNEWQRLQHEVLLCQPAVAGAADILL